MRLTLRTLLAYLDDVLEPAETREIGRKIQESPLAAAQMSRIREVIRRRRLGTPELDGPGQGIDPNLVAEYLDNTLSADQVGDIERVCLESDLQLAEVAACHQILTLVLGEPQDVPPQSLDRFYALGPVSAEQRLQPTNGEAARSMKAEPLATRPVFAPVDHESAVPDYLKPTPWSQRFGPIAGLAIVLLAAVAALMLDRDLARNLFGEKPAVVVDRGVSVKDGAAVVASDVAPEPKKPAVEIAATTPTVVTTTLPAGIDPTPPPDVPETTTTTVVTTKPEPPVSAVAATTTTVQQTTESALPAATKPPVESKPMPTTLVAQEPAAPRVLVPRKYISTEGILVRYQASDQHWYVQPRRSDIHPDERFATPDPYEATFDLDNGRIVMTMLGDTALEILPPTEQERIGIRVHRGRVVLQRSAAVAEPVTVVVAVDQNVWTMELAEPGTVAGVEVRLRTPYRYEPPMAGTWYQAAAFVGSGSVRFLKGDSNVPAVAAGSMRWLVAPAPEDPQPSEPLTAVWLDPQQRQTSATLRRYALLFEKEFDPTTAVDLSIPALTKDPRPKIAELAARCLSVTELYPSLVTALAKSEHPEARQAAAAGLRAWLVQAADRQGLLKRELSTHYPGDEATPVHRLLIGVTPEEAKDRLFSLQLVEWLRSNYVEVRELAIGQLERLTNRRYDYRPNGTAPQRERDVQRWLTHIERYGAIIAPDQ